MKKRLAFLSIMLLSSFAGFAQITIESCYEKAQANYPLIKQYGLIEKMKEYNLSNVGKGYLPQISLSARATYQSDVTQLPLDFSQLGIPNMDIPVLSKDQYGVAIDINQTVWDGGIIKSQKESISASSEVDKTRVDVSIYSINERVNQVYFGILLVEAQIEQNILFQEELKRRNEQVSSYIDNGIANQSDLDAIKVDQLKAKQNNIQLTNTKKTYIEMLSLLIGEPLALSSVFVKPEPIRPSTSEINRPELAFYQAQIKELDVKNREITSMVMPKFGLFLTGGYGKPGLDMLNVDPSPYYIGGLRLSWNISSFYTNKSKRNTIQTSKNAINVQREIFLFNNNLSVIQIDNVINSYLEKLKYDDEIISLRNSVKRASEVKMSNGTISGTDLIRDINAEQMAIQDKIFHEMELLLAIYNLKFTTNN